MWKQIEVKDWQHFDELISAYNRDWIFRGQRSVEWSLESSLYRECKNAISDIDNDKCVSIEQNMLLDFKSSYKLYSNHRATEYRLNEYEPDEIQEKWILEENLSSFSIMQHYGTPTRLIDWTYSPYIAMFFALDGAVDDFCIYALNLKKIENYNKKIIELNYTSKRRIFFTRPKIKHSFLYSYVPYEKNERLRKQQGLFLVPSHIDQSIDDILDTYEIENGQLENEEVAVKIIISKDKIQNWWFKLMRMNINHETIYPGLEGFCKSLKSHILK